jgi:ureidoacrylate peracid hydrolase
MEEKTLTAMPTGKSVLVQLQAEPRQVKIDLQKMVVMVIDMQNGYVSKGGLFELRGFDISRVARIIKAIQKITNAARVKGYKVIYVVTRHPSDLSDSGGPDSPAWYKDAALNLKREHPEWQDKFTIRGTWGAEIIEELKPREGDIVFEKMRYSAFFQTNLDTILKTYNIKYIVFTGVAINICVEATIRDAYYLGYFPILVSDATDSVGANFLNDATIHNVKTCYGWVTDTENVLQAIEA